MVPVSSLLLTLTPIVVIIAMLVIWKKPADISGIVGWVVVSIIAFFFFQTNLEVLIRSTITGVIRSFAVSLVVAASLLQMAYMEKTGALKRIIIFIKTIACENKAVQIMMINIGFGTLMVSVGATPVSLLPPIMLALGYSTYVSIALPCIGYDALCTYALLGAPIVVFVDVANSFLGQGHEISLSQAGSVFFMFLPVISTLIGFCMLWIVGRWQGIKDGWLPVVITGAVIAVVSFFTNKVDRLVVLTGIMCGAAVIIVMSLYLLSTGKKIIDKSRLTKEEIDYEKSYPFWKALTPWGLLVILILGLNLPTDMFNLLYREITLPLSGLSADGKPIVTRALWNAYTWIFVSTFLSMIFIKPTKTQLRETFSLWWKRAPRPVFAAIIFFVIGEIMNMSGFDMTSKKYAVASMVQILANFSSQIFSDAYGSVVAFIGLLGGFITGSEASTIAMFATYTLKTSNMLHMELLEMLIITAGLAFGGGLASVISPAKLQNASAAIDKLGEETAVIRIAFVFAILLTAVTAALVMVFLAVFV
ncbi:L-lactate permease [Desulfosporosinus meridiei DSM 13257]|uniref:L-lactate permease n=1 Tax=Desulfosporosinus meridiei (strain ATCC BAA-275 / DSM 13257 / KCTC 12902 / NCIMB 13706 / S10) TaxID=768704 RepID=J7IUT7_DESMD|nr:L-lactate permease [Desulfosporosinus meridiei DSM 13257]